MVMSKNFDNKPYSLQYYDYDNRFSIPNDSVFYKNK